MYLAISTFSRYVLLFLDSFVIRQRKKEVLHKARNLFYGPFLQIIHLLTNQKSEGKTPLKNHL